MPTGLLPPFCMDHDIAELPQLAHFPRLSNVNVNLQLSIVGPIIYCQQTHICSIYHEQVQSDESGMQLWLSARYCIFLLHVFNMEALSNLLEKLLPIASTDFQLVAHHDSQVS